MNMIWHSVDKEQLFEALGTGLDGLSEQDAASRLSEYGHNELKQAGRKTILGIILSQFKNLMILVLLAASVVSASLGEYSDAVIIFAVILLNAVMGTIQEARAEAALEALKKMAAPAARVIRDGALTSIKAQLLVPGDLVLLEAGDFVPADLKLVKTASLKTQEAALTGESVPSEKNADAVLGKDTPLAERINMAYSGTSVVYGHGMGVVCQTGMDTQIGHIAQALNAAKDNETPLQRRLNALSKVLSFSVLGIAAIVFCIGILSGRGGFEMFLVAVSLAVAAIPEGLATVVTLQLTMGVQKMSKNGAIVRQLPAVETLGSTSVICSDKTGTLTQNKMSVQKVYLNGQEFGESDIPASETLDLMNKAFLLCNDTQISSDGTLSGDPTETALFAFSSAYTDKDALFKSMPRVYEIPFDSERKLMSTVNGSNSPVLFVKGAPDELLPLCTHIAQQDGTVSLTDEHKQQISAVNEDFAKRALRVLGAAYKPLSAVPQAPENLESGLCFIGLAGMIDPPRSEAKDAVETCKQAGILPVMITGDHKITAVAIARQIGILGEEHRAVSGQELDAMNEDSLHNDIGNIRVYARVAPEHKVRIVSAFRALGHVVAMTGDGVNDAPALKAADIGVGMGVTGTEVSKNASDMVLTDDNFATIVHAVREGRRIFRNIKKAVLYLLSANLSEVLTLFIGTILGFIILHPVQILWVNLVTDTFPALALGLEKAPADIMRRKPRDIKQSFFADGMMSNLVLFGIAMAAITLGVFFVSLSVFKETAGANTMAFLTLGFVQLFHIYNVRSDRRSVFYGFFTNKWIHIAFAVSFILQASVVWIAPLGAFFKVVPLSPVQWIIAVFAAALIVPVSELAKAVRRLHNRKTVKAA